MSLEPIHHSTYHDIKIYKWIVPITRPSDPTKDFNFYEFVTPCCDASAKWFDDGDGGEEFLCRVCKTEVDELHGTAPTTIEELEFIKELWSLTADEREEKLATVR